VDYNNIGMQAVIPAGQDSVSIVIHPIMDTLVEPTEYIMLVVNTSACTYDTIYIYIKDNSPPVPVMPPDTRPHMSAHMGGNHVIGLRS